MRDSAVYTRAFTAKLLSFVLGSSSFESLSSLSPAVSHVDEESVVKDCRRLTSPSCTKNTDGLKRYSAKISTDASGMMYLR